MPGTEQLRARHVAGDRYAIEVRGHTLVVDQPVTSGGEDTAPTPTELFVAGLAGCVAFYAGRYCIRHDIDPYGLEVSLDYTIGGRPARVDHIAVHITPPAALPVARRSAFLAVASHCTVHNSLADPPAVHVGFATPPS